VGAYAGDQVVSDAPYSGAPVRFDSIDPGSALYVTFVEGGHVTL